MYKIVFNDNKQTYRDGIQNCSSVPQLSYQANILLYRGTYIVSFITLAFSWLFLSLLNKQE
jgi:hypothetical protein